MSRVSCVWLSQVLNPENLRGAALGPLSWKTHEAELEKQDWLLLGYSGAMLGVSLETQAR